MHKQGSFVTRVLNTASALQWPWPWAHYLQNVITSSNHGTDYLYKIRFKSFNPLQSYCGNKFYTWPWPDIDLGNPTDLHDVKCHCHIVLHYILKFDSDNSSHSQSFSRDLDLEQNDGHQPSTTPYLHAKFQLQIYCTYWDITWWTKNY